MSLRVRFQYSQGASLGYSIERLSDGYNYDFNDSTFKSTSPTTQVAALTAGAGNRAGVYSATLTSTPPSQFSNGDYAVYINNTTASNAVISIIALSMYNGDDVTVFPAGPSPDPLGIVTPGSYAAGVRGIPPCDKPRRQGLITLDLRRWHCCWCDRSGHGRDE